MKVPSFLANNLWIFDAALNILTLVLVVITGVYAWLTHRMARTSEQQLELERTPNFIVAQPQLRKAELFQTVNRKIEFHVNLLNISRYAVYLSRVVLLDSENRVLINEPVNEILQAGEAVKRTFNLIIRDTEVEEGHDEEGNPVSRFTTNSPEEVLKTTAKADLYFQYGATGQRYYLYSFTRLLNSQDSQQNILSQLSEGTVLLTPRGNSYQVGAEPPPLPIIEEWARSL